MNPEKAAQQERAKTSPGEAQRAGRFRRRQPQKSTPDATSREKSTSERTNVGSLEAT